MPGSATSVGTTYVADAVNEKVTLIFMAPRTGNIDRFEFNVGVVTNSPDNGLRASLQSVDMTTGQPTGTILGATNGAHVTYAHTVTTGWKKTSFAEVAAVTRGDILAAVIDFPTFVASDNVGITNFSSGSNAGFPYGVSALTTKVASSMPVIVLHYTDGYEDLTPLVPPITGIAATSYHSGTAVADEWGMAFTLPYPARISKISAIMTVAAAANYEWVLYDSSDNVITG